MRLIDADALIKDIDYSADMGGALGKVVECVKYYAKYMVASAPTTEERKKGKWIDKSGGIEGAWNYCSVCGEQAIDLYDFCPNCGADMREQP